MGIGKYFKRKTKEDVGLIALCEKIIATPFRGIFREVEIYLKSNDFEAISNQIELMRQLEQKGQEDRSYSLLLKRLESCVSRKEALDKAAWQLEEIRVPLLTEIINFGKAIKEVGERYKLSPNWEGKKPILIEKQKELEARKKEYEKMESQLNTCFLAFYQEYEVLDKDIRVYCNQFIQK